MCEGLISKFNVTQCCGIFKTFMINFIDIKSYEIIKNSKK